MQISGIDVSRLSDSGQQVSVAIVDSGFLHIPSYATIYGVNSKIAPQHGNRIVSIFSALDNKFRIAGMTLSLACYNPSSGYGGLADALRQLPESDILSLSMSWKEDNAEIRSILESKFRHVCVPAYQSGLPYPAAYPFSTTCASTPDQDAMYSIMPNRRWHGNSYSVPAVARLMAYGIPMEELVNPAWRNVDELFAGCESIASHSVSSQESEEPLRKIECSHCHRYMRDRRTHQFLSVYVGKCPYCGFPVR